MSLLQPILKRGGCAIGFTGEGQAPGQLTAWQQAGQPISTQIVGQLTILRVAAKSSNSAAGGRRTAAAAPRSKAASESPSPLLPASFSSRGMAPGRASSAAAVEAASAQRSFSARGWQRKQGERRRAGRTRGQEVLQRAHGVRLRRPPLVRCGA